MFTTTLSYLWSSWAEINWWSIEIAIGVVGGMGIMSLAFLISWWLEER